MFLVSRNLGHKSYFWHLFRISNPLSRWLSVLLMMLHYFGSQCISSTYFENLHFYWDWRNIFWWNKTLMNQIFEIIVHLKMLLEEWINLTSKMASSIENNIYIENWYNCSIDGIINRVLALRSFIAYQSLRGLYFTL